MFKDKSRKQSKSCLTYCRVGLTILNIWKNFKDI